MKLEQWLIPGLTLFAVLLALGALAAGVGIADPQPELTSDHEADQAHGGC